MEEAPPPVPPKDPSYRSEDMDMDNIIVAPPSSSKRKRNIHDHDHDNGAAADSRNGRLEIIDPDAHTPKRSRSHLRQSDADVSDDTTSGNEHNLRRKKKVGNLSMVNLRHAAQRQAQQQTRASRFQEGSLTDKPSAQPPSVFTRMIRTDSGNVRQVDELMAEYHDGMETPRDSVELEVENEKRDIASRVSVITAESVKKDDNPGGLFRFGRSWASSFRPVALWNKLWNETREDLIRQNIAEAERKAKLKAEAEAKYAEMKAAGQFNTVTHTRASTESARPRDSAIVLDSARTSLEHKRDVSGASQFLAPPKDDSASHSGSDVPDTDSKTKTMRSRFHFKRPSLSNLKSDLKRVKSDFNLAASTNRESSSSLSPVKAEISDHSILKKSRSKLDLKKTHKLSKRVSDLEAKLSLARRELDVALVEASPMPKLGNRYARFTPQSTLKRPKFVPGKLPTLPSERLLNPEQLGFEDSPEPKLRQALDLTEEGVDESNDDTIKARSEQRPYPARATSLFTLSNHNFEDQIPVDNKSTTSDKEPQSSELIQINTSEVNDMDPNSIVDDGANGVVEPAQPANYSALDAKLKALDANVKVAKKSTKSKKRKSAASEADAAFKPDTMADDDDDLTEAKAKPKKKQKSGNGKTNSSSPQTKRSMRSSGAETQSSPQGKKATGGGSKKKKSKLAAAAQDEEVAQDATENHDDEIEMAGAPADDDEEAAADHEEVPSRTSMDSQGQPLEPLYEEEEETSIVQLNDAPSKPTAHATPARFGRHRSKSPNKRAGSVKAGAEETMMVRAAAAAQMHPGRSDRSASPTATKKLVSIEVPVSEASKPADSAAAGDITRAEALDMGMTAHEVEDFQWPDDVF